MVETRFPNRWFGSNPQAISNHGKKLSGFSKELPKDWRSALEADGPAKKDESSQDEKA